MKRKKAIECENNPTPNKHPIEEWLKMDHTLIGIGRHFKKKKKKPISTHFGPGKKTACLWWNHCVGEDLIVYVTQLECSVFTDLFFFLHFLSRYSNARIWLLCWITFVAVLLTFIALVIPFMRCFGWINVWPYTQLKSALHGYGNRIFVNKWNVNVEYSLGHFSQNHF